MGEGKGGVASASKPMMKSPTASLENTTYQVNRGREGKIDRQTDRQIVRQTDRDSKRERGGQKTIGVDSKPDPWPSTRSCMTPIETHRALFLSHGERNESDKDVLRFSGANLYGADAAEKRTHQRSCRKAHHVGHDELLALITILPLKTDKSIDYGISSP